MLLELERAAGEVGKNILLLSPKQDRRANGPAPLVDGSGGAFVWLLPGLLCHSLEVGESTAFIGCLRFLSGKGMVLRGSENRIQCVT